MGIGLPEIDINFKQAAASAIARSARGFVAMVVKDDTDKTFAKKLYLRLSDVDSKNYTAANMALIKSAFLGAPSKVLVVRIDTADTFADAVPILDLEGFDWLCFADEEEQSDVTSYVKSRNAASPNKRIKAVVYDDAADDMHIVNFANASVTTTDDKVIEGFNYLPRLAGLLAGLPFSRSATYFEFSDLKTVEAVTDLDAAINAGKFCLFQDEDKVRVARGVNSLTTLSASVTEDMRKIAIVEAMDMICKDISQEFSSNYLGRYKNSYDNQCLLISAINGYFRALALEEVLDGAGSDNLAAVDVETQRQAWIARGVSEAAEWDDNTVKNKTLGSKVYLMANIKILDAIEDIQLNIIMA